jgi:putative ABC transport system permease protein
MNNLEVLKISLSNVRGNLLRAIITMFVIAFGIAALVGILTAIDTAIFSMSSSFSSLGSRSFSIAPTESEINTIVRGEKVKRVTPIDYKQAMEFKERFALNGRVAVSTNVNGNTVAKYGDEETNPVLRMIGVDENEMYTRGNTIAAGRFFNRSDIESAKRQAVIGKFIVNTLFNDKMDRALGKSILLDGQQYKVIGILESQGASMNQDVDKKVMIPISLAKQRYGTDNTNYAVDVAVTRADEMDNMISESIGLMRKVRRLKAKEENDFEIRKADGIIKVIKDNTVKLRWAAVGIGIITLLGAAIGLMNIMLVSVTERTKEIGIIKALGATRSSIVKQFLVEAVLICQMGGLLGILLGIMAGVLVSYFLGGEFVMPWLWIILGISLCMIVGLASGLYPALKAARLDPIECLRYE